MRWGMVSNCWAEQLRRGEPLEELIAEAARLGYADIELRQGSLGTCERGEDHVPDASRLAALAQRFPQVTFNLAMQFAWFDPDSGPDDTMFLAGVEAARALGAPGTPHLRLVDLTSQDGTASTDFLAQRVVSLAEPLRAARGRLSLENAGQPWEKCLATFRRARILLGDHRGHLRLCYDPCNLLSAADEPNPTDATAGLAVEELSMLHVKQRHGGTVLPDAGEGDIDWATQFSLLKRAGYQGPVLLEIAPHAQVRANLERSRAYVETLTRA